MIILSYVLLFIMYKLIRKHILGEEKDRKRTIKSTNTLKKNVQGKSKLKMDEGKIETKKIRVK